MDSTIIISILIAITILILISLIQANNILTKENKLKKDDQELRLKKMEEDIQNLSKQIQGNQEG